MPLDHKYFLLLFPLLLSTLALSCPEDDPGPSGQPGEMLFFNGSIYTVNPDQPWAEAIFIRNGYIEFVGSNQEAFAWTSDRTEEIDLEGAFVMPGIHDVHLHPLEAATDNFQFILDDSIEDPEDYSDAIFDALQENLEGGWLLGWGHWIDVPLSATRMPKLIIDEVAPNRPVAIMEQTSHSIWCNSKALELMGIDTNTPDPPGGIIMRAADGTANGLLIDNAGNLLLDLALTPSPERTENDYLGLIEFALPELAQNGITSICDARTYWQREHHLVWDRLEREDVLTVRVNLGLWAYPAEVDNEQINNLRALYRNDPNSLLKINQIKVYCDGIIHNTTSAMHDDFLVDYFGRPTNNGLNYFSQERITEYISALEGTGFDFHIHAIGNRGVHEALNAIEAAGTRQGRHRLTHVEYVDPVDIPRFAALNVTADAQVAGDFTQPVNWFGNNYLIGSELNQAIIPLHNLSEAGARITLSSDWDVSDLNPFIGLQNAVTRSPQQISLEEAIAAYTINAAYVMRQEELVGSLEVGKAADLIILDRHLFEIDRNQINQTRVEATYLEGELIYER
ncbi:MAG: amidohydrolase family protein [Bacteroidota bacterium]